MRTFLKSIVLLGALVITSAALGAQSPTPRPMRPMLRRAPVDSARRQALRQRLQSMSPEQKMAMKQHAQAARAERRQLAQSVRSGQLTRAQARQQMFAWQKANRMNLPRSGARRQF